MKVEIHILTFNEEEILPFTLRHYDTYADRIHIHDAFSTDRTRAIASSYGAFIHDWDTKGEINDELAKKLKNSCWKGTDSDVVGVVDADELLYFPQGAAETLASYDNREVAIVCPHGFELMSDTFPTGKGQIYDYVKKGARDDKWYGKPVLFFPKRIQELGIGIGAHDCKAILKSGEYLRLNGLSTKTKPDCYLLHCKHIGPVSRIAKEYDEDLKRLSAANREHRWGNQKDGLLHAQEKRAFIRANLQTVIY